jgi:hypothetical protein
MLYQNAGKLTKSRNDILAPDMAAMQLFLFN